MRVGDVLLRRVPPPDSDPRSDESFDPALAREVVAAARRATASATFVELISSGRPLDEAVAATVRALAATTLDRATARAFALGMVGNEEHARIGLAQVRFALGAYPQAWEAMAGEPIDSLRRLVPIEAVASALVAGTPESVAAARTIATVPQAMDCHALVELAGRYLVAGHREEMERCYDAALARDGAELSERDAAALKNLSRWREPSPAPAVAPGAVSIGIIDYYQPDMDRASRNVGDYVQTLSMLGNLARFGGVRFSGPDGLGELITGLQERVRQDLIVEGREGVDVHVRPISRDFSAGDEIPPDTWVPAFGWHMHPTFELGFGLPYHPNVRPIFVSFHVNRVAALTDEAIGYLQRHGPVGCRDWTTVDLLLSAGVDAFFTGCVTTTVDAVFPLLADVERDRPGVIGTVDLPKVAASRIRGPVEEVRHGGIAYREAGLVTGVEAASDLLSTYQRRFRRVVTSRLHAYLPATALGLPVRFRPAKLGDVRFDGLLGLSPGAPELTAMQERLRGVMEEVFGLVLRGTGPDAVYARWREMTGPFVAEARGRWQAPVSTRLPAVDLLAVARRVRAEASEYGARDGAKAEVTEVAMSLDQNFAAILPVALESLVENASCPLRVWITTRGLDADYQQWVQSAFPTTPLTFLSFDGVEYGEVTRMIRHISIATMDRLLLPEVLPDLDRLVYVDLDTVTEGDVCELGRLDLEGHPLAARTGLPSFAQQWRIAGDKLAPEVASELRRRMSTRHHFDFHTFNAGVLVLDLDRMRRDDFVRQHLPFAAAYGLNDQDILNAYAGRDRAELAPRWNALPILEAVGEPGIIHFAGAGKPWADQLVPYGDRWRSVQERVQGRVGSPPA